MVNTESVVEMPIKDYVDRELGYLKELVNTKLGYNKEAVDLARSQMEDRLEGMNEFRAQLKDQTSTFVSRELFDKTLKAEDDRIDQAAKSLQQQMITQNSAFDSRLKAIELNTSRAEGKSLGIGTVIGAIIGVGSFIGIIIGIVLNASKLLGT